MKNKKTKTEEFWQQEPTYQTGSTVPPKNYGGIIAFLLVLVIFLCGIATALGLMNIRLFRQLSSEQQPQQEWAVAFSESPRVAAEETDSAQTRFPLGFTGQTVPEFWQHYHDLPRGIYICLVEQDSSAQLGGLLPGDVLTALDGVATPDVETLRQLLSGCVAGQKLQLDIFREGAIVSVSLFAQEVAP